ncbi:MAG: DUF6785 family protein [Desulfobacterales bacterium]
MKPLPEPPSPPDAETAADGRIRPRAVALGLLLGLAICALTPFQNAHRMGTPLGGGQFPLAPFYVLLWAMAATVLLRALFRGRRILTGRELLLAWALMVLMTGIAWTGLARGFFIHLTAPAYFASAENRWEEILLPLLPASWIPRSREAIEAFYNGLPGGRQMGWLEVFSAVPWSAWAVPLVDWGIFIGLSWGLMLCIVSLLSRQPLYNERMNFPLLRVPFLLQEAFDEDRLTAMLLHRFFLVGVLVPVVLHAINGLSFYNPSVPSLPTLVLAGKYFPKTGLFSGFVKLKIHFYPAFIGFAFLTAKPVSFSLWFFFLAGCLLSGLLPVLGIQVPAAALGTTFGPTLSRVEEMQVVGANLVFFAFLAWLARFHLFELLRCALGRAPQSREAADWIPTRPAFWGMVACGAGLLVWLVRAGLPPLAAALLLGACLVFLLVAVRVVCQGGIPYFTLTAAPLDGLTAFLGSRPFTAAGLAVAAVAQKVLFLDLREALMPALLHARKVTDGVRHPRRIALAVGLCLAAAAAVSCAAMLVVGYKFGIRDLSMDWALRTSLSMYEDVVRLVQAPAEPGRWVLSFVAAGAGLMLVLVFGYHRFYWWPIHPIGYLTAYSSAMGILWFSFFVGWLANVLCLRYAGTAGYRELRLFFVGLIVGDFFMAGNWALYGLFSYASYLVLPE